MTNKNPFHHNLNIIQIALEFYQRQDDEQVKLLNGFSSKADDKDERSPARRALKQLEHIRTATTPKEKP